jgi:two-component system cell cycle response regulator PopA
LIGEPRLLLLGQDDARIGPLARGLDSLGWRTLTGRNVDAAAMALTDLPLEGAVIDARGFGPDAVAALRRAAAPRSLPVISLGHGDAIGADLHMTGAPHPVQIGLRLEQLMRAAVAEEEFTLRRATFSNRGQTLEVEEDARPIRILAAGAPDRRFLGLSNALRDSGAEVVAAPTPYTAFDYLHEAPFDAVILWGGEDHTPALSIASGMKRNTRLFHIPVMLYLRQSGEIDLAEIFQRGIADVASAETPEGETARRGLALAGAYRRQQGIRRALDSARASDLTDPATGLFTREMFALHLSRIVEAASRRRRPVSVCVLRVASSPEVSRARAGGWLDRALPQIGSMTSRLVRSEDTAGRLAPEVFALALPATRAGEARIAAERIAAVIGCTAFDAGPDQPPFVLSFDLGVAELLPGEPPAGLLERASAELTRIDAG